MAEPVVPEGRNDGSSGAGGVVDKARRHGMTRRERRSFFRRSKGTHAFIFQQAEKTRFFANDAVKRPCMIFQYRVLFCDCFMCLILKDSSARDFPPSERNEKCRELRIFDGWNLGGESAP